MILSAATFDRSGEAVIATTPDGHILYWNTAAERLYGWRAQDVQGRAIGDVTPAEGFAEAAEDIMGQLRRGQPWSGTFPVQRRDGSRLRVAVTDLPVFDGGRLVAVVGFSRPDGPAPDGGADGEHAADGAPGCAGLEADGLELLATVDDVLALDPAGARPPSPPPAPAADEPVVVALDALVAGAVEELALDDSARCGSVEVRASAAGPAVRTRPDSARLLVRHLLRVAAGRVGPEGSVAVTIRRDPATPARLSVHLRRAAEAGPPDATPVEARDGTAADDDGGLRLARVRGLVGAVDGALGVATDPDGDTVLWLDWAPAADRDGVPDRVGARPVGADPAGAPGGDPGAPAVLYIEDNPSNRRLVDLALSRTGVATVALAASGVEGVALARSSEPDLVLLDVHLPDISGEEVLRRLRAHESTAGIPVVVLSADATPAQIAALLAAGAAAYLTKPLDLADLRATVAHWAGRRDA